jgi:hypothetical protein
VSDAEHATILAALRFYQRSYRVSEMDIDDIATNGGEFSALDASAIDELAERINCESA